MQIKNHYSAAVPLTVRGMEWKLLTETVCRMAGFCSSANRFAAPALPYYRPSMDICKTCTSTIHGGRSGIRAYMDVFTACLRQQLPIHVSDSINIESFDSVRTVNNSAKLTGQLCNNKYLSSVSCAYVVKCY